MLLEHCLLTGDVWLDILLIDVQLCCQYLVVASSVLLQRPFMDDTVPILEIMRSRYLLCANHTGLQGPEHALLRFAGTD